RAKASPSEMRQTIFKSLAGNNELPRLATDHLAQREIKNPGPRSAIPSVA
ncbi:hypothetical protein A2U01_0104414, partial [Trifolium medium]|nr:hypothetical protein [Trifolium medium]